VQIVRGESLAPLFTLSSSNALLTPFIFLSALLPPKRGVRAVESVRISHVARFAAIELQNVFLRVMRAIYAPGKNIQINIATQ
jgi:hypothetical protein